ncbi:ubiquinol-cytochrome c reductase iron-sulfur subunit [Pseudactinotalea sp. Z1748]|uniref:QcrA and Rieske domain-containing protein n=1 Tax=Pseudactinotalea sp. Z1748 TaxID=3413027 RepID=UPI003C7B9BC7
MSLCPSRRQVLATVGLGAGGAMLLSACGAEEQDEGTVSAGKTLIGLEEVGVGDSVAVQTPAGATLLLTRTGEADVVALSAVCTHQGCTVDVENEEGRCPCHGSRFDLRTGEVTAGPAKEPLARIAVEVIDGQIVTA